MVANGPCFGRGMRIAPEAHPDDGWADVVIAGAAPAGERLWRLLQVYAGAHGRSSFMSQVRVHEVTLEQEPDGPPLEMDGEMVTSRSASVQVVPGALRLVR